MGFKRALLNNASHVPSPLRSGDGLVSNFNITLFNTESDENLTVAQIAGGLIFQGLTLTSDVVYSLPTAAALAASDEFASMDVGDAYTFAVTNSQAANFLVSINVNTGITAKGTNNAISVERRATRLFTLVKTGAATFDLY